MKDIQILHLYSEHLDLYGDQFNLVALKKGLEELGHRCTITCQGVGDSLDFQPYDLIYMGHGKASNLKYVLPHLAAHKAQLVEAIEGDKYFLVTGNGRTLLGQTLVDIDGTTTDGLGIFSYSTQEVGQVIISDLLATTFDQPEQVAYGFINRTAHMTGDNEHPWFTIKNGGLSDTETHGGVEGTHYRNFHGTWQMGPLLPRNPHLLKYFLKGLLGEEYAELDMAFADKALNLTVAEFK